MWVILTGRPHMPLLHLTCFQAFLKGCLGIPEIEEFRWSSWDFPFFFWQVLVFHAHVHVFVCHKSTISGLRLFLFSGFIAWQLHVGELKGSLHSIYKIIMMVMPHFKQKKHLIGIIIYLWIDQFSWREGHSTCLFSFSHKTMSISLISTFHYLSNSVEEKMLACVC